MRKRVGVFCVTCLAILSLFGCKTAGESDGAEKTVTPVAEQTTSAATETDKSVDESENVTVAPVATEATEVMGDVSKITETPGAPEEPTETPAANEIPTPTPVPTPTEVPHEHSYAESITMEATCETDGEKSFLCECGDNYKEVIKGTGHSYGNYVYNKDATYEADGTETAECTACGATDTRTKA